MLAVTLASGWAHTPPGGFGGLAGLQNVAGDPEGQTTIRRKPIDDGPNFATEDRGVGGVVEDGLHDRKPSGRLCVWSGAVQGAYAGTNDPRAGDAPTGVW